MKKILVFILLMVLLTSCDDAKSERELWESLNISDYHMNQIVLCFCPDADIEYTVHIKNDTIYSITESQTQQPVKLHRSFLYTMDGLFDLIEDAYKQNAYVLKVEYDSRYHFPKRIEIDYSRQMVDDEITVLISDFEVNS